MGDTGRSRFSMGLSARLLLLTVFFIMLSEFLIWAPSIGRYRKVHIPSGRNERAAFCETFYYEASNGDLGNGPADVSSNPYFPVFETAVGRIGVATCLPGDVVLGTMEGVMFIPPHLAEEVVVSSENVRLRDEFGQQRIAEGVYTAGEVDREFSMEMERDYDQWVANRQK